MYNYYSHEDVYQMNDLTHQIYRKSVLTITQNFDNTWLRILFGDNNT